METVQRLKELVKVYYQKRYIYGQPRDSLIDFGKSVLHSIYQDMDRFYSLLDWDDWNVYNWFLNDVINYSVAQVGTTQGSVPADVQVNYEPEEIVLNNPVLAKPETLLHPGRSTTYSKRNDNNEMQSSDRIVNTPMEEVIDSVEQIRRTQIVPSPDLASLRSSQTNLLLTNKVKTTEPGALDRRGAVPVHSTPITSMPLMQKGFSSISNVQVSAAPPELSESDKFIRDITEKFKQRIKGQIAPKNRPPQPRSFNLKSVQEPEALNRRGAVPVHSTPITLDPLIQKGFSSIENISNEQASAAPHELNEGDQFVRDITEKFKKRIKGQIQPKHRPHKPRAFNLKSVQGIEELKDAVKHYYQNRFINKEPIGSLIQLGKSLMYAVEQDPILFMSTLNGEGIHMYNLLLNDIIKYDFAQVTSKAVSVDSGETQTGHIISDSVEKVRPPTHSAQISGSLQLALSSHSQERLHSASKSGILFGRPGIVVAQSTPITSMRQLRERFSGMDIIPNEEVSSALPEFRQNDDFEQAVRELLTPRTSEQVPKSVPPQSVRRSPSDTPNFSMYSLRNTKGVSKRPKENENIDNFFFVDDIHYDIINDIDTMLIHTINVPTSLSQSPAKVSSVQRLRHNPENVSLIHESPLEEIEEHHRTLGEIQPPVVESSFRNWFEILRKKDPNRQLQYPPSAVKGKKRRSLHKRREGRINKRNFQQKFQVWKHMILVGTLCDYLTKFHFYKSQENAGTGRFVNAPRYPIRLADHVEEGYAISKILKTVVSKGTVECDAILPASLTETEATHSIKALIELEARKVLTFQTEGKLIRRISLNISDD